MCRNERELISELVRNLETEKIPYAILRNYENFPEFEHDVDLVIHKGDLDKWRKIAIAVGKKGKWDVITECDHWAQSRIAEHNIEIFRFYRRSPISYLQVDIFHGFLVWGLPLLKQQQMLQQRKYHASGFFQQLDPFQENIFRILQIYSLMNKGSSQEKIASYQSKILNFYEVNAEKFCKLIKDHFSEFGIRGINALQTADINSFATNIRLAKMYFFAKYLLRHPLGSAYNIFERVKDYLCLFITRQCGFPLQVHAPDEDGRLLLKEVLNLLTEKKVLYGWTDKNSARKKTTWQERKLMERGGIVIKWVTANLADFDVTQLHDQKKITTALLQLLISRDNFLDGKTA